MSRPDWITFDCYDTLIDFAIDRATLTILGDRVAGLDTAPFLATFAAMRAEEEADPVWKPYRQVLAQSLQRAMTQHGLAYREADGATLAAAIPGFGPHPDVPPALRQLQGVVKLAILSNSDDDLIAGNVARIGVPFDRVVTAEQARAYKPALSAFRFALDAIGCPPERAWHVAQDFERDIVPAADIGYARRIWINRYHLTGDAAYAPDHELPNLTGLPDLVLNA